MAKYSPFRCPTHHAFGYKPCVVGKVGSHIWQQQRPLSRWHASRLNALKSLNALLKRTK